MCSFSKVFRYRDPQEDLELLTMGGDSMPSNEMRTLCPEIASGLLEFLRNNEDITSVVIGRYKRNPRRGDRAREAAERGEAELRQLSARLSEITYFELPSIRGGKKYVWAHGWENPLDHDLPAIGRILRANSLLPTAILLRRPVIRVQMEKFPVAAAERSAA